jgi:hypothetical protein
MLNQFSNLSCYEEFEIQSALAGISKINILKEIGHKIDNYYFFVSDDGLFNWYDLEGNHIEDPGVLKTIIGDYIPFVITKCVMPNSVTHIDDNVFAFCTSLNEITIPDGVTSIGDGAFFNCKSLTSITIPDNVTYISYKAFSYCESLTSITIPDSVTSIGNYTFFGCESLKEVIFKGKTLEEVKQMENYPFGIEDESIFKFS